MTYIPYATAGLLIPYNDTPHLFAVMNPECENNLCLTIMITSIKDGKYFDPACVLDVGDHPFVKHQSYLLYRMAETTRAAHISNMVGKKYYIPKDDFPADVFGRISAGIRNSEDTPLRIIRYADQVGI
ncbi:MAG: hypothetical protein RIA09_00575 [Hoeflea sp.]|uniref:hypothetical protein n=1 Tax=Hoeflea sp. TaxID=1940281 RepID=UPI0032EFCD61